MTDPLEKIPPQSQEAEMSLLGSCLMDMTSLDKAAERLKSRSFYNLSHQTIFRAMLELYTQNTTVDVVTMSDKLRSMEKLDEVGGTVYLTDLVDAVSTTTHTDAWIDLIQDKAIARALIQLGVKMQQDAYTAESSTAVLEATEAELFNLSRGNITKLPTPTQELVTSSIDTMERIYEHKNIGITTGLLTLDRYQKFQPGHLWVLAARPSMGKTSLALKMAFAASQELDTPAAIFSVEMGEEDMMIRLISQLAQVNPRRIQKEDWKRIVDVPKRIIESRIIIDDLPALTMMQLRSRARRYVRQHGVGFIVIDYLQKMQITDRKQSYYEGYTEIIKAIAALGKELSIRILVCSQLNRDAEKRASKKPEMADLRESGAIEQEADVVVLLFREAFYFENSIKQRIAELRVAKNTYGPVSDWRDVLFVKEHTRFEDLSEKEESDETGERVVPEKEPEAAFDF